MRPHRAHRPSHPADGSLWRASDDDLMALARDGNTRAFEAIVQRYRPALTRYCASLTRAERVDDAVQQAFVSAWLALDRGVSVRSLRPWLYAIARNAAVDQLRVYRGDDAELSLELGGGSDPAAVAASRSYFEEVLHAVAELPERQRTALLETAVHGRATEAVADDLGVTGGALRQLVHRARTTVRTAITSIGTVPMGWFSQPAGDEAVRRVGGLAGGAGAGAFSLFSKSTAAVLSASVVAAGGIATTAEHRAAQSPAKGSVADASGKRLARGVTDSATRADADEPQRSSAARTGATATATASPAEAATTADTATAPPRTVAAVKPSSTNVADDARSSTAAGGDRRRSADDATRRHDATDTRRASDRRGDSEASSGTDVASSRSTGPAGAGDHREASVKPATTPSRPTATTIASSRQPVRGTGAADRPAALAGTDCSGGSKAAADDDPPTTTATTTSAAGTSDDGSTSRSSDASGGDATPAPTVSE